MTSRLYGGDRRVRIRQELLLGVGGYRALQAMGVTPGVLHLNEGHSVFASLEAIRPGWFARDFDSTRRLDGWLARWLFTTHTPVAAGHDRFRAGLIDEHLGRPLPEHRLGHDHWTGPGAGARIRTIRARMFCMTVLGLKLCAARMRFRAAWRGSRGCGWGCSPTAHGGRSPDRTYHQRGPREVLAGAADDATLRPPPGPDWPNATARRRIWEGIDHIDDGELSETST